LMVAQGREVGAFFGRQLEQLQDIVDDFDRKFAKADECIRLAQRVIANSDAVRFTAPESKGMLIYQLTRFGAVSWAIDGAGWGNDYLPTQRKAVLAVLRQAHIVNDLKNVIQHIGSRGAKADLQTNLGELRRFFAAQGPGGLDVSGTRTLYQDQYQNLVRSFDPHFIASGPAAPADMLAMNGDFDAWYDTVLASLMDEPVRGQMAIASSDPGYALLRDGGQQDHPLFASTAGGFYNGTT
jgi:hypothetical protein